MAEIRDGRSIRVPRRPEVAELKIVRHLVAIVDRDGTVAGLFARPSEARIFLQEGRA